MRRSHDRLHGLGPLFIVSAWSVHCAISLGQFAIEEKSNEITAIPELLENLDVQSAFVTIDAAGCQKNITKQIVDQGGDYVLALNGNQETIHQAVEHNVAEQIVNGFSQAAGRHHTVSQEAHGRRERYEYHQFAVPPRLKDREKWAQLRTIGVVVRVSEQQGKFTCETRYFLSSLGLGVKQFAEAVRGHWAIENTLNWCLDITFREDESRLRNRIAGENVTWLKRFAIGPIKQHHSKDSVAMRRRKAGWSEGFLMQLLGISIG